MELSLFEYGTVTLLT